MDHKELRKQLTRSVSSETQDEIREAWQRFGIGLLVVFGVIILVLLVVVVQRGTASRPEIDAAPLEKALSMDELEDGAARTARAFLEAQTIAEKARFVMTPRRVMPLMEQYYQRHPMETRKFKELVKPRFHVANEREFVMGHVVFKDEDRAFWVFEKDADGSIKLQWEAVVNYSSKDWDTFLDAKDTEGGVFRVTLEFLMDQPYYNHDFSNPELYHCFMVRNPKSDRYVYGYLEKSGESHKSFLAVRAMSPLGALPVLAKLRFPEDAHGEQVLIEDIRNFSWVPGIDM